MTKIYLVNAQGCNQYGSLDVNSKKELFEVFTNKKLAQKCADFLNQSWSLGFKRNADFKKDKIRFYYVETRIISHEDWSKIPY